MTIQQSPRPVTPHVRRRRPPPRLVVAAIAAAALVVLVPTLGAGAAPTTVGLGTAESFAVLAGAGITNTGATAITGDVGTFPTTSETGFGTVTLTGTNHAGDAVTQQAKTDLVTAYDAAAASGPVASGFTDLGGLTLTTGVYSGGALGLTGTLTLNAQGDPNAVFIFQAASTLITASGSTVSLVNGAQACNVFWQVGSSATLATGSTMVGTVMALTSITATTGATVQGRLLARNGAVTLDANTITASACAPPATTTTTGGSATSTTVATPGSTTVTTSPGGSSTTTSSGTPTALAFTG